MFKFSQTEAFEIERIPYVLLLGVFLRIGIPLFYPCDEQGGRDVPEVGTYWKSSCWGGDAEYFDIPVPAAIW